MASMTRSCARTTLAAMLLLILPIFASTSSSAPSLHTSGPTSSQTNLPWRGAGEEHEDTSSSSSLSHTLSLTHTPSHTTDRRPRLLERPLSHRALRRLDRVLRRLGVHRLQQPHLHGGRAARLQDLRGQRHRRPAPEVVRRVQELEDVDRGRRQEDDGQDHRHHQERLQPGQVHQALHRRLLREEGRLQGHRLGGPRALAQVPGPVDRQARQGHGRQVLQHHQPREARRMPQVPERQLGLQGAPPEARREGRRVWTAAVEVRQGQRRQRRRRHPVAVPVPVAPGEHVRVDRTQQLRGMLQDQVREERRVVPGRPVVLEDERVPAVRLRGRPAFAAKPAGALVAEDRVDLFRIAGRWQGCLRARTGGY